MNWQIFIAIILAIPIILLPVSLIWYLNIGGIFNTVKRTMARRACKSKKKQAEPKTYR